MGRPIHILLAEDNTDACRLIKNKLESVFADQNVTVLAASTLENAKLFARTRAPIALALIDLCLADSEAKDTLKAFPELGCKIIAMSGVASGEQRHEVYRYGASDYIEKPVVIEVLIDKVARALQVGQPERNFADIQRRAQAEVVNKTANPAQAVVLSPVSSKWLKVILPGTGMVITIMAAAIGFILGGWRTASAQGAEKQATLDKLTAIETTLNEVKANKKDQDATLIKLQIDVGKLLVRNGIPPEK